eukprot:2693949-Rhodomonas_salina.2
MVFMSAWTILGRALFADALDNTRANFDTFYRGFLTLFQVPDPTSQPRCPPFSATIRAPPIFTGDSWTAVLYDGMKVPGLICLSSARSSEEPALDVGDAGAAGELLGPPGV